MWLTFDEPGDHTHIEEPALLPDAIERLTEAMGTRHLSDHLGIPQRFIDAMASRLPVSIDLGLTPLSFH